MLSQLGTQARPRLEVIWADGKYHNHKLHAWIETSSPGTWRLEVVRRPKGVKGFVLLPKRWVVKRTFSLVGSLQSAQQGLRTSHRFERIHVAHQFHPLAVEATQTVQRLSTV